MKKTILISLTFALLFISNIPMAQQGQVTRPTETSTTNYDSILRESKQENRLLTQKIDIQTTVLNGNSALFTALATYFTFFSILVVIVLPLVNYFLVIKPNRTALKEMTDFKNTISSRIDKEFDTYFKNFEKREFKKLIAMLKIPDTRDKAIDSLFLKKYDDIDDEDLKNLYDILSSDAELGSIDLITLHRFLTPYKNLWAEKYFRTIIEKNNQQRTKAAASYFVDCALDEFLPYLRKMIAADQTGRKLFHYLFDEINERYLGNPRDPKPIKDKEEGTRMALLLLNDQTLIDVIKTQPGLRRGLEEISGTTIGWNPFIKDTYYYKEIVEKKPPPTSAAATGTPS